MAKINLLAGNRLNVQFGSTPDDAVVVSNEAGPARKGIVGGKIVIEENYGKGIVGGSIFVPEETVAQLGGRRLISVGGKVYQAAATERLVNIGGKVYYEYAQATGTPAVENDMTATASMAFAGTADLDAIGEMLATGAMVFGTAADLVDGNAGALNNNRISSMHFLKMYQPIAVGS